MADWYVSSAVYATVPQWAATHAYVVGDLVRPLTTPANGREHTYRCTTAGTSASTEPSWVGTGSNDNGTVTSGGATFTNVSGQSTYGWSAAAGTLAALISFAITGRTAVGDRVFVSSDHSETTASVVYASNNGAAAFGLIRHISVNRAGSVPPVEADIQSGAAISSSAGNFTLEAYVNMYWQGITFTNTAATNIWLNVAATARKSHYFKNCAFVLTNASVVPRITTNNVAKVTFDNTTIQFGHAGQAISNTAPFDFNWINTPSAIQGATIPTTLFTCGTAAPPLFVTCRGVDLSAVTGTLCSPTTGTAGGSMKALFDSCKVAAGVTRLAAPATISNAGDEVELVNCYDGINTISERWSHPGSLTVDRSTYMNSGAQDDIGNYALKLTSNARADKSTLPLQCFAFDVENTVTGASKTATVEIISAGSLNNDDISLLLEYMGTSGSPIASFVNSLPATALTAGSALSSSSATWANVPTYSSWNPNDLLAVTLSNSNLTATTTAITSGVRAITGFNSGKYYFEITVSTWANSPTAVGMCSATLSFSGASQPAVDVGKPGTVFLIGVSTGVNIGGRSAGDIIGIAVDITNSLIWFRVAPSGNWNGSGTANPATGIGGINISSIAGKLFPLFWPAAIGEVATANFGASAFSGAVPSGFTAGWPFTSGAQKIQVTFTPQVAGRVRGLVRLGNIGVTAWINPQIAIT